MTARLPEVWLRGPVPEVPTLLQPVAHALLQCREELNAHLDVVTPEQLRARPGGAASIGYHLRHAAGSLDRLFTYARGEQLSAEQMRGLAQEADGESAEYDATRLRDLIDAAIDRAIHQLRATRESSLSDRRGVGRQQLPSTVLGLLFHAAEHTQRHAGQAATTARILRGSGGI
jgi:uncharacterized damage-inducible protein DinB